MTLGIDRAVTDRELGGSPRRAYEQILLEIERAIARGELSPGDRLPAERDLAENFGVSRASVREALRVLEALGVVVARRGNGADSGSVVTDRARDGIVSSLRFHTALGRIPTSDFVDLRVIVEAESALRAAALTPPPTGPARELLAQMGATDTSAEFLHVDMNFHVELVRLSGNALLPMLMESVRELVELAMIRGFERLEDWRAMRDQLIGEHVEIVDRIEDGDGDGAAAAVRAHILGFYRTVFSDEELAGAAGPGDRR